MLTRFYIAICIRDSSRIDGYVVKNPLVPPCRPPGRVAEPPSPP